ncbi:DUF3137 domain-containing protein [Geofilum sp. OHC36d9]|uniref:DUF3137 domain-containing protein n=1 Tax=Geofilum sp. OHC36d9 TaxID=3458413 RepID=UPI0040335881
MTDKTKNFDDFYNRIYPKLEEIEGLRSLAAKKVRNIYTFGKIGVVVSVLLFFIFQFGFALIISIVFAATFFGMLSGRVRRAFKELGPLFKRDVIENLLDYFYDEVRYIPRQRMSAGILRKSLLFKKTVYRSTGDDFTECRIGDTNICFSEVQAYSKSNYYFFNGIFVAVEFNKIFTSKTIVIPNSSISVFRKIRMNIFGTMDNASMVVLEDVLFNKEFDVISEDQVESRYLLSTSLMQRLIDFKIKVNKDVSFSFIDNWLYVAIPTKVNLFEISLEKPVTDNDFIRSNYEYFQLLTGLVEDLDLNTKIWK